MLDMETHNFMLALDILRRNPLLFVNFAAKLGCDDSKYGTRLFYERVINFYFASENDESLLFPSKL